MENINGNNIPKRNLEAFCLLYEIEIGLREFIVDKLSDVNGAHWYNSCLPQDVYEKYKDGIVYEKNINWVSLIPHHPVYYIDFTDLKKIIEKNSNWNNVFKTFLKRKEIVINALTILEYPRNCIAHNRKISNEDYDNIKSSHDIISNLINKNIFDKYISGCTCALDIKEKLSELRNEILIIYQKCSNFQKINDLNSWELIKNEWWFDNHYLNIELQNIYKYYELIIKYINIPRVRGCGHKLEKWIKDSNLENIFHLAIRDLKTI